MRAWLKGLGPPIPLEALPDSLASGLPQYYIFQDGETFVKADATDLGYTHFEVWCFGAAGGEGGGLSNVIGFTETISSRTMTEEEWNLHLELTRIVNYFTAGQVWDHQYFWSHSSQPDKFLWTAVEKVIAENPTRQLRITTFTGAHWIKDYPSSYWMRDDYIDFWGGAGGGGGLHVVSGPLADIPDEVLVRVGNAGVNSEPGHSMLNGVWTPIPEDITRRARTDDAYWAGYNPTYAALQKRQNELYNYFSDRQYFYPEPHTSFNLAQPGGDGGSSSFGDICLASGGKGGDSAITWPGGVKTVTCYGGAGGIGDELVAGGGAPGSISFTSMGQDGTWDGVIGKGGGGGSGGGNDYATGTKIATDGGRGSYAFADTSVYGHRQLKSADGLNGRKTGLMYRGGSGGGARTSFNLPGKVTRFGSHAVGYSPNGGVIIRVYKVD